MSRCSHMDGAVGAHFHPKAVRRFEGGWFWKGLWLCRELLRVQMAAALHPNCCILRTQVKGAIAEVKADQYHFHDADLPRTIASFTGARRVRSGIAIVSAARRDVRVS
ncbi:hypothetical protein [Paraburkholderia bannensis]|uniref:hypothetical protein n=1 Tax=Paraburkholderia bannensis TaxID=765414 RepID=UPI0012EBB9D7|nr:hypothetical protein [Paraburkholderia bannensis]